MKIYLAIPYTGYEDQSFKLANTIAALLIRKGYLVYSPISHSHPICKAGNIDGTYKTWRKIDEEMIKWCDIVYVVTEFREIQQSKGVMAEIEYAKELKKPISYFSCKKI